METKQKIVCVIPARLASTRFPEKMLVYLAGKPLLQRVWDAALATEMFDDVVIAGDDRKIFNLVTGFGGKYVATSPVCASGTDRLIEVMKQGGVTGDIWVNWQGDEPFISKDMIEALLQSIDDPNDDMWTLKKRITIAANITAPNIAKVVCDVRGYAMYFSRSQIPFVRDNADLDALLNMGIYYKHVGIYAYRPATLERIAGTKQTVYEEAEKLEQLRFLHYGVSIRIHETNKEVVGIDTPNDLAVAESLFNQKNG
ncbi:MAG: 3-deoxy-manno-octulosonate cytidylyltransferase [Candidatus Babeliales bacterium]